MFLKYLEIQGFKSFPDKEKIEFNMGITGIVGPNGSGKSNISDAIRWVMGEQSIKSLRGGKMEDVIFAGTAERKPVGFAEVSICFDNTDKMFKTDYDEVLITRRYFRSGESEYYLNKTSCRLKDIHELLMDTGMGRDGYSVIGQGKIDEIVSSKPEDRRVIIEEAAGISKYRYRKAESERKLSQTKENLTRLLDLMSEIEGRLEPLRKDSEKAKKYLAYRDELKEIEISLSLALIDGLKSGITKVNDNIATNSNDILQLQKSISDFEERLAEYNENAMLKEKEHDEAVRCLYEIKNKISSMENDISILNNSKSYNSENYTRITQEIKNAEAQIESENNNKKENSIRCDEFENEILLLEKKLEEFNTRYDKMGRDVEISTSKVQEYNDRVLELYRNISDIKSFISSGEAEKKALINKISSNNEDKSIIDEDIQINEKRLHDAENEFKSIQSRLERENARLIQQEAEVKSLSEEIGTIVKKIESDTILVEQIASKIKMLTEMEKDMEGYAHSVKTIIRESNEGILRSCKIYGTLSKLMEVPNEYAVSVEAALGNNLQNIVTETQEDAKKAIEYLKQTRGGRATFLPLDSVRGKKLDDREFKSEKGFVAIASDIIECAVKFRPVVDDALGRTIIIDNIDNAIKFARKFNHKYKLATIEGEIFNSGGSVTGGNLSKNLSFLSRGAQIKELQLRLDDVKKARREKTEEKEISDSKLSAAEGLYNELSSQIQSMKNELYKNEYNYNHFKEIKESLSDEAIKLDNELEHASLRIKEIEKEVCDNEKLSLTLSSEIEDLKARTEAAQAGSAESSKIARELNTEIIRLTVDIADLKSEKESTLDSILRSDEIIKSLEDAILAKKAEIERTGAGSNEIDGKIHSIREKIKSSEDELSVKEESIRVIKTQREKISSDISETNEEIKVCNEKLLAFSQEKVRLEERLAKNEAELENISTRLWEDYELTYLSAEEYRKPIENKAEVQKKVNSLKQSIRALGNVNMGAVEEYSATKERYDFLTGQKNDMENAGHTLEGVISDIESLMAAQFKKELEIINTTFSAIFKEMFSGGDAELVVTDDKDILNCGIEIHAQPPGKKLQNMTLFSGGEKAIIAISLLFALLEVRPSPLCVLDEIEAALDDVNVYRFAQYLRKISKRSQIAIITHRRGTMEEADMLYGVTMQNKGISRLLPLNINDVEKKILKKN